MSNTTPSGGKPTTGDPKVDVAITLFRYLLVLASTWIASRAGVSEDQVLEYGGIAIAVGVAAYGAWRTHNFSTLLNTIVGYLQPEAEKNAPVKEQIATAVAVAEAADADAVASTIPATK